MSNLVETCWGMREISSQKYWHLAANDWSYDAIFKNNVRIGKTLFKELNHSHKLDCVEYFRPLALAERL